VHSFNGIGVEDADLEFDIEVFNRRGRIPVDLLPIATDPFGNLLLLGMSGPRADKVYFWDHNTGGDDVTLIANSFDDFLALLRPLPDEMQVSPSEGTASTGPQSGRASSLPPEGTNNHG
jgi:hypothetical protein